MSFDLELDLPKSEQDVPTARIQFLSGKPPSKYKRPLISFVLSDQHCTGEYNFTGKSVIGKYEYSYNDFETNIPWPEVISFTIEVIEKKEGKYAYAVTFDNERQIVLSKSKVKKFKFSLEKGIGVLSNFAVK